MAEKLTPEEIKKALECCVGFSPKCNDCPANRYEAGECSDIVNVQAISVMNSQQAEIERLLQKLQQPQAETIKEFIKKLKDKKHIAIPFDGYPVDENDWAIYGEDIDEAYKELVGELT